MPLSVSRIKKKTTQRPYSPGKVHKWPPGCRSHVFFLSDLSAPTNIQRKNSKNKQETIPYPIEQANMPFKCTLCLDVKRTTRSNCIAITHHEEVCTECFRELIVEQFWNSIRNPSEFPFRFGSTALRFQDYAQHIPGYSAMLRAYSSKKDELETPDELRVYCDRDGCSRFLGEKKTSAVEGEESVYECDICGRIVCAKCKKHATADHVCRDDSEDNPWSGFEKGKDIQFCPNCSAPGMLDDGCNSARCKVCRTEFCFICGAAVKHGDKEHWQRGQCSRFNHPDAANAMFDDEVVIVDDPVPEDPAVRHARWGPLFRARIVPARERLREIRNIIQAMQRANPDPSMARHFEDTLHFLQSLTRNYGLFNLQDNGRWAPGQQELNGGPAAVVRHEQIRAFADSPVAEWAWERFQGLRDLRLWYLNHLRLERVDGPQGDGRNGLVHYWFGEPEMQAPLQGQW